MEFWGRKLKDFDKSLRFMESVKDGLVESNNQNLFCEIATGKNSNIK